MLDDVLFPVAGRLSRLNSSYAAFFLFMCHMFIFICHVFIFICRELVQKHSQCHCTSCLLDP